MIYDTPGMLDTKGLQAHQIMGMILKKIATSDTGQIDAILLLENPNSDKNYGDSRLAELQ